MTHNRFNRAHLVQRAAQGERLKFVFFWGHTERSAHDVTKACFSQWRPSPFTVDGATYATAEHWMMAEKARLMGDDAIRSRILDAKHPADAKKLGRQVQPFDNDLWQKHCLDVVIEGNIHKFGADDAMREVLLATGDRVLVEASPKDRIWGIGLAADHDDAKHPQAWRGENLLGEALMHVRERLRG